MFLIEKAAETETTEIKCPNCRKKLSGVRLTKGSKIEGLIFKCVRCNNFWKVKAY